jgi:hypothetical protein
VVAVPTADSAEVDMAVEDALLVKQLLKLFNNIPIHPSFFTIGKT